MLPLLAPLNEQEEGFRMEVPADAEPRACSEQVSEVSELGVAPFHVLLYSLACGGERVSVEPTDSRHPGEGRAHLSRLVGRQDLVEIREGDAIQLAWMVRRLGLRLGLGLGLGLVGWG